MAKKDVEERFWSKVDVRGRNECWEWQGSCCNSAGHGKIRDGEGKNALAHRISYELQHGRGSIPHEHVIAHSCDNPKCVNPAHLRTSTQKENMADMIKRGRGNIKAAGGFRRRRGYEQRAPKNLGVPRSVKQ